MLEDALGRGRRRRPTSRSYSSTSTQCAVSDTESPIVAGRLEHRQCLVDESAKALGGALGRREHELVADAVEAQPELVEAVAGCREALRRLRETRHTASAPCPVLKRAQLARSRTVRRVARRAAASAARSSRLRRGAESPRAGSARLPAALSRSPARVASPGARRLPELLPVAVRLLEVVSDQLVELDELGSRALRASRRTARAAPRALPSAGSGKPRRA